MGAAQSLLGAAGSGDTVGVQKALQRGDAVNQRDRYGRTALHLAAAANRIGIVRALLGHRDPETGQRDALVDAKTDDGATALHLSAGKGHLVCLSLLLEVGAQVDSRDEAGNVPLHYAANNGVLECMDQLLRKGAQLDSQNEFRVTPIHCAAGGGHDKCLSAMLERGAYVDAATLIGETPLHYAAWYGRARCVRLLVRSGAFVNATTSDGETPLHKAAGGGHLGCVLILLQEGSSVDRTTKHGYTALHHAASSGNPGCVRALLQESAEIDAMSPKGFTPLHKAALYGHQECVQILILEGAFVNSQSRADGKMPSHLAAAWGHVGCLRRLVEAGGLVNSPDDDGRTALHAAAAAGHLDCVRLMLEWGADASLPDMFEHTPRDLAKGDRVRELFDVFEATSAPGGEGGDIQGVMVPSARGVPPMLRSEDSAPSPHVHRFAVRLSAALALLVCLYSVAGTTLQALSVMDPYNALILIVPVSVFLFCAVNSLLWLGLRAALAYMVSSMLYFMAIEQVREAADGIRYVDNVVGAAIGSVPWEAGGWLYVVSWLSFVMAQVLLHRWDPFSPELAAAGYTPLVSAVAAGRSPSGSPEVGPSWKRNMLQAGTTALLATCMDTVADFTATGLVWIYREGSYQPPWYNLFVAAGSHAFFVAAFLAAVPFARRQPMGPIGLTAALAPAVVFVAIGFPWMVCGEGVVRALALVLVFSPGFLVGLRALYVWRRETNL